jgi:2-dehydro-3-deoxygluconokinase
MSVLTVGETMALLDPTADGRPELGAEFRLRVAGAESNVAIGLARLGVAVTWVSRLGRDPFGDVVLEAIAAEGVDVRFVLRGDERTGLFAKARVRGRTQVAYWREGSAASRLGPGDVPDDAFDSVRLVHLTGITMAISETGAALVVDLARRAKERGLTVTFDPNFRPALPDSPDAAAARQRAVLPYVDWYLCGEDECRLLWGDEPVPVPCVVRVGARGALVEGEAVPPARIVTEVVDEVGAGDAFATGFIYGLLRGWAPRACAHAGNLLAGFTLGGTGDWELLPRLEDVTEDLCAIAAA